MQQKVYRSPSLPFGKRVDVGVTENDFALSQESAITFCKSLRFQDSLQVNVPGATLVSETGAVAAHTEILSKLITIERVATAAIAENFFIVPFCFYNFV